MQNLGNQRCSTGSSRCDCHRLLAASEQNKKKTVQSVFTCRHVFTMLLHKLLKRETDWANQLWILQFAVLRCDQKQCFNSIRSWRDIWAWHQEHGNCLEVSGSDHTFKILRHESKRFAPRNQQNRCARLDKCFNKARDVNSVFLGSSTSVRVSQLYICIQIRIYIYIHTYIHKYKHA